MDCAGCDHRRLTGRLAQRPPMALFENFTQRISNGRIVLFAADFFFCGTGEADNMVGCDATLLGIKFRELDRIGNGLVVENDRRLRQRLLRGGSIEQEEDKEQEKRPKMFHLEAKLEAVVRNMGASWQP